MKKILAALAASGILVAGGFATAAISTPAEASAQTEEAPEGAETDRPDKGAAFDEVFDQLVADGVISADQAEQVKAALQAKRDELREEFGDRRGHRHRGLHLRGLLEDGVIDAAELAGLPEGHPLTDPDGPAAEYLDDGQLTLEELQELRGQFGRGGRFGPPADGTDAINA